MPNENYAPHAKKVVDHLFHWEWGFDQHWSKMEAALPKHNEPTVSASIVVGESPKTKAGH